MEITERTIATARGKGVEHFDDVLLVGGMTIMPAVARTLRERFGLEARQQDPHLAVAKGAALFALLTKVKVSMPDDDDPAAAGQAAEQVADQLGISGSREAWPRKQVTTVVPRAFGLKVVDEHRPHVQDRSGPGPRVHLAPAHRQHAAARRDGPEDLRTVTDNQRAVQLEVWEQAGAIASEELEHNTRIGEGTLEDLPPRPAGAPFQVVFHMTETGLLTVHAWEDELGPGGPVRRSRSATWTRRSAAGHRARWRATR